MKKNLLKIVAVLACIIAFTSCVRPDTDYVLTYRVYYGPTTLTKEYCFKGVEDKVSAYVSSDRGSNHLHVLYYNDEFFPRGTTIESNTAPIEIVSLKKR